MHIYNCAEGGTNSNTAVIIIVSVIVILVILAIAVLITTPLLIIVFHYYRRIHRINNKHTMKITIMNGIDGHIAALQVFKVLIVQ